MRSFFSILLNKHHITIYIILTQVFIAKELETRGTLMLLIISLEIVFVFLAFKKLNPKSRSQSDYFLGKIYSGWRWFGVEFEVNVSGNREQYLRRCFWKVFLWMKGAEIESPTFSPHSHFHTFFEATVLTLISVVLVDGAIPASSTRIC